ncbi:MAG TPA: oligosaccharide flippase family protein [Gaiella sp.]
MSTVSTDAGDPGSRATGRFRAGRAAIVLSVLTLLASGVNYLSNLVFSRLLTPESYGDLTALLALSVVIGVPLAAAQTRIAERVAALSAAGDERRLRYTIRHALGHLAVVAAVCTAVYALAIPLVDDLFDLQAPGPAIALAPLLFVGFLFPVLYGTLQGLERYVAFGLVLLAVALSRLLFGVPWVEAGGGAGGAIGGQAIGMAVCLLLLLWFLRGQYESTGEHAARSGMRRRPNVRAVIQGGAFVTFALLANMDVVLAKLFLAPDEAGDYAALATIGKIVTFLPAVAAVLIVPRVARAGPSARARAGVLRRSAAFCLGAALLAAVPAAIAPGPVVDVMFGDEYAGAESGVLPIVVAGAGLSLIYLLVVFTVTIEDLRWTLLPLAAVGLQVAGITAFHASAAEVAVVQAVVVTVVLLTNEVRFHSFLRPPSAASGT